MDGWMDVVYLLSQDECGNNDVKTQKPYKRHVSQVGCKSLVPWCTGIFRFEVSPHGTCGWQNYLLVLCIHCRSSFHHCPCLYFYHSELNNGPIRGRSSTKTQTDPITTVINDPHNKNVESVNSSTVVLIALSSLKVIVC
jgi:hypothetical protein